MGPVGQVFWEKIDTTTAKYSTIKYVSSAMYGKHSTT